MAAYFDITVEELKELVSCNRNEVVDIIKEHGGIDKICEKLSTSPVYGIVGSPTDIINRKNVFGTNAIPPKVIKPLLQLVWEALQDIILIILMIAALLSTALSFYHPPSSNGDEDNEVHSWLEGLAICCSVIVVVTVTAFNDYSKERQFRGLQDRIKKEHKVFVIRNREIIHLSLNEVVVGDMCMIKYGDLIPADGILIQHNDLQIDESLMTGESDLVEKNVDRDPLILSGTQVMEGTGKILIIAVGIHSQAGILFNLLGKFPHHTVDLDKTNEDKLKKINNESHESSGESVLQAKLTQLAIRIGYVGCVVAILTVAILVVEFSIRTFAVQQQVWHVKYINMYVQHFIIGVTILVVAIPEGLPLAVTLALAYSVKKMMKDNNLVRHISACETMGNATTICSDKTGTLTTNRMTVVQSYICEVLHKTTPNFLLFPPAVGEILVHSICINSIYTSHIVPSVQPNELPKQVGNKTECALLAFVENLGKNYNKVREEYPESKFVHVYTFNSTRKLMATVIPLKEYNYRLFAKGASEVVLNKCKFIFGKNGQIVVLTEKTKQELLDTIIEPMASNGLRTLVLAYRDFVVSSKRDYKINEEVIDNIPKWDDESFVVSKLTAICVVGIEDPVRPEVPNAIKICQQAGITVRMVTGDNINTARSIALKCGIIKPGDGYFVLEAKEFNDLIRDSNGEIQQHKMDHVWPKLRVLARSSPTDKFNLVKGIIENEINKDNEIVAVTGDGTNDGPALKRADVGFAMGIAGTDVAKEASDIILTDDNLTSIVKAVMWGRNVYDSIAKFLQFQLTVNVVAVVIAFVGGCTVFESPLRAVQMLWINLIMDTLASLALATEPPTAKLLLRKPYGRKKSLISGMMLSKIISQSIYQIVILFTLLFYGDRLFNIPSGRAMDYLTSDGSLDSKPSQHFTIIFTSFVLMTLFNEINSRKLNNERNIFTGIYKNPIFVFIWLATLSLQILIVEIGGNFFYTHYLTFKQWMWCFIMGFSVIIWGQIISCIPGVPFQRRVAMDLEDSQPPNICKRFSCIFSIKHPHNVVVDPCIYEALSRPKSKSDLTTNTA